MSEKDASDLLDGAQVTDFPSQNFTPAQIQKLNERYAVTRIGSRSCIIQENGKGVRLDDRIVFMSQSDFRLFESRHNVFDKQGRYVPLADVWLRHPMHRHYEGVEFAPSADGTAGTPDYYNLWQGFEVDPDPSGECGKLLDHILHIICQGDLNKYNWVMAWFASIVQKPGERFGTSLTLRGDMGCGKTMPIEYVGKLIEPHYFQADEPEHITGRFNSHLRGCLLLQAEEAFWAGDKRAAGRLKGLVTSAVQMIEMKGIDAIRLPNYVRLACTTNEDWVVPAGLRERRFAVLDVSNEKMQNHAYFDEIVREMEAPGGLECFLYELLNFDLSAVNMREIPLTGALLEQKLESADPVVQWWFECLENGQFTPRSEWPAWIQTTKLHEHYVKYCEIYNIRRPKRQTPFTKQLKQLCPAMARVRAGRTDIEVIDDDGDYKEPTRPWGYTLPILEDARHQFNEAVGQTYEWDKSDIPEPDPPF